MKITRLVGLYILCFLSGIINSQQLRFKHITSEEGLSTNFVLTIIQDEKGFMWFGTQDGLNKYDGYQVKVFKNDPTDSSSIFCSFVTVLGQIKEDLILVGTKEGLSFFNPMTENFSVLETSDSRLKCRINDVFRVDDQTALIASEKGLFELNFKTKKISKSFFGNDEVYVNCVEKVNNIIYFGTNNQGLYRIASNQAKPVSLVIPDYSDYKESDVLSITHIGNYGQKMYLSTYGNGVFKVDQNYEVDKNIRFNFENGKSNFVKDFEIKNNKLYAATMNGFVVYNLLSEETNLYIKQDDPLALNSNIANCVFLDNSNNFWIGTDIGGVNISFSRSLKFPTSTLNYESKFENISCIYEDAKGTVLLGGVNVFHELNLETGKVISHEQLLEMGQALCIAKENESVYWVGSYGQGIYRYDKQSKKSKNFLSDGFGGTIVCLFKEGSYLYAGSIGDGLFKIDLTSLEIVNFTKKDGLPGNSVNTIFKDSKGKIWLGTGENGLVKLSSFDKGGKLPVEKVYSNNGKLGQIASNSVYGVNEDKHGNIWVATSTGLSKLLANQSFYNFYEKDGLASTFLYSILKDSTDNFWMSSNSGIIKFDPKYAEKDITFKNYNIKDGLLNTEYNMGAAFAAPSGMMYFGGAKGFNSFRPSSIKDNVHVPESYVIGYQRGGNDVATDTLITYKKHLQLSWSENYFQFELVALDFTDPEKNKFKYMLEGYDKDWSAPTNVRYVSYTALPGGEYKFKVKSSNNDGVWNEKPFEIKIVVVPPFWKTKTFYIIVVLLGIALIYFYTQYRTKAILKENKILENKVALRTKQLEEKNKDITSSIEYAKRIQEAILPSKEQIFRKLKKVFILYQPKDIVSGDFYWFAEENGYKIFAVVDCTGHGVPGAFMSMIGHNLLHQIVLEKGITDPGEILNHLHKGVQDALRQGQNEINTNDGMDVSIIAINDKKADIKWAGANRPLILIDNKSEFSKYDGNKFPVGGAQLDNERVFTTHQIITKAPSMAYMFSDGYADQFGGEKGKKFMVKRFHDLLSNIHLKTADEQRVELKNNFEDWRKSHEQVDDVLIVGIEI